jgi:hypothetical protein
MNNEVDIARLATLIDTEGCIFITRACRQKGRRNGALVYHRLRVVVSNTDLGLMQWLKEHFGGYIGKQSAKSNKLSDRLCFNWIVHSKAAEDVLRFCLPYFLVKRKQAEVALIFRDTFTNKRGRRGFAEGELTERDKLRDQLSELKRI